MDVIASSQAVLIEIHFIDIYLSNTEQRTPFRPDYVIALDDFDSTGFTVASVTLFLTCCYLALVAPTV